MDFGKAYDHFNKSDQLYDINRFEMAEKEIKLALEIDPENTQFLGHLCRIYIATSENSKALPIVRNALELYADSDYTHYLMSIIQNNIGYQEKALTSIDTAIEIDPDQSHYHAWRATLCYNANNRYDAKLSIQRSLAINSEEISAHALGVRILIEEKDFKQAKVKVEEALQIEPENQELHDLAGQLLLRKGKGSKALDHYGTMLRENPNNADAKHNFIQAYKAKNPLYSLYIRYSFWSVGKAGKVNWLLTIGYWIVYALLSSLGREVPTLLPLVITLKIILVAVVVLTWIIHPLSNVLLLFDNFGKLLLSKAEQVISYFVLVFFGLGLTSLVTYLINPTRAYLVMGVLMLTLIIPISRFTERTAVIGGYVFKAAPVGFISLAAFICYRMLNGISAGGPVVIYGGLYLAYLLMTNYLADVDD